MTTTATLLIGTGIAAALRMLFADFKTWREKRLALPDDEVTGYWTKPRLLRISKVLDRTLKVSIVLWLLLIATIIILGNIPGKSPPPMPVIISPSYSQAATAPQKYHPRALRDAPPPGQSSP